MALQLYKYMSEKQTIPLHIQVIRGHASLEKYTAYILKSIVWTFVLFVFFYYCQNIVALEFCIIFGIDSNHKISNFLFPI